MVSDRQGSQNLYSRGDNSFHVKENHTHNSYFCRPDLLDLIWSNLPEANFEIINYHFDYCLYKEYQSFLRMIVFIHQPGSRSGFRICSQEEDHWPLFFFYHTEEF